VSWFVSCDIAPNANHFATIEQNYLKISGMRAAALKPDVAQVQLVQFAGPGFRANYKEQ